MEEQDSKWDIIRFANSSNLEITLILLAEALVIYMQVTIIEIEETSIKELFKRTKPVILFQQFNNSCINFQKLLTQHFNGTWG